MSPAQEERIKKELVDRPPNQLKLKFALQAVRAAITQMIQVDLPVRTVRKYLARWGFTPQRPVKRAYEQRAEAVEKWLKDEYPGIVARAKAKGAEISWADETAASSVEHHPRGYAPRGNTPLLVLSQSKHCRIDLSSAVINRGTLRFTLYRETLDADMFIKFLKRLHKDAGKKVFLAVDYLRVHHATVVSAWLAEHAQEIELFYLPSYSPEFNPDEYLNADLKARMNAGEPVQTPEAM